MATSSCATFQAPNPQPRLSQQELQTALCQWQEKHIAQAGAHGRYVVAGQEIGYFDLRKKFKEEGFGELVPDTEFHWARFASFVVLSALTVVFIKAADQNPEGELMGGMQTSPNLFYELSGVGCAVFALESLFFWFPWPLAKASDDYNRALLNRLHLPIGMRDFRMPLPLAGGTYPSREYWPDLSSYSLAVDDLNSGCWDYTRKFKNEVQAAPSDPKAWERLGDAQVWTRAFSEALQSYKWALDLSPNNIQLQRKIESLKPPELQPAP